jgi:thiamine monophosphate synthase
LNNIDSLLQKGARNISLIRAITEADDIALAAGDFRKKLDDAKLRSL